MKTVRVDRNHNVRIAVLSDAADLINGALNHERYGASVLARMPGTFPADFAAGVAALAKAAADQSGAKGDVNTTSVTRRDTLGDCVLAIGTARATAKRVFTGQAPLLHSEFTVGEHTPRGIESVIARAEKVHAACAKYADAMASKGWTAAETAALAALITALKDVNRSRLDTDATQHMATVQQVNIANAVYDQIRSVQIVANQVYPAAGADKDATIVEAREHYLLGVFPPRQKAAAQAENTEGARLSDNGVGGGGVATNTAIGGLEQTAAVAEERAGGSAAPTDRFEGPFDGLRAGSAAPPNTA